MNFIQNKKIKYFLYLLLLLIIAVVLLFTCSTEQPSEIYQNQRPETHLFLYPGEAGLDAIRASFHLYNSENDVHRVLEEIRGIVAND